MNLNKKSKKEHIFILTAICFAVFGIFCISGCGGQACETVKCGNEENDGVTMKGVSIPGCGGCFDSILCEGCLCAKSYKAVSMKSENMNILGCDERYMQSDCQGCHTERSCYMGCSSFDEDDMWGAGYFYGKTPGDEHFFGCMNGCVTCNDTGNTFGELLRLTEIGAGVD